MTLKFLSPRLARARREVDALDGLFRKKKLIGYSQSVIVVFEGVELASASCRSYRAIKDEYDNYTELNVQKNIAEKGNRE